MSAPLKLHFDQATLDKVEAFHESIKDRALEVVQKVLPAKILALNDRIETANKDAFSLFAKRHYFNPEGLGTDVVVYPAPASSSSSASASSTAEPAAKKRKGGAGAGGAGGEATVNGESGTNSEEAHVYTGVVRTNEYVNKVHDDLREEHDEMISLMDSLKMWINIMFPRIEDGDTFGVSVQEEALTEIHRSQDTAYNLLSTPLNYVSLRGDMAAKLVRYPGVEDHALALREYDRKAFYKARQQLVDLRNVYTVVLDILRKNIDRISKPKSGNQMGSYG